MRPWQGSVPECGPTLVERLPYPADQEDCGLLLLGWRGPDLLHPQGLRTFTALSVLLRYLCDTPAAPLQKVLTEVEHPYASNVSLKLRYLKEQYLHVPINRFNIIQY